MVQLGLELEPGWGGEGLGDIIVLANSHPVTRHPSRSISMLDVVFSSLVRGHRSLISLFVLDSKFFLITLSGISCTSTGLTIYTVYNAYEMRGREYPGRVDSCVNQC